MRQDIDSAVHQYSHSRGVTLSELESIATKLKAAYTRERANLDPRKRYRMPKAVAANYKLWMNVAIASHKSGMPPDEWMRAVYANPELSAPYPYHNNLPHIPPEKVQGVSRNLDECVVTVVENQIKDSLLLMQKLEKSLPEVFHAMGDRFDALFCWCLLRRAGFDAEEYRTEAQRLMKSHTGAAKHYTSRFPEEVGALYE